MENNALLFLLESVLGKGHATSKGNYAFNCPVCSHHKPKLEINSITNAKKENQWHCWVCGIKGKTIKSLFKTIKAPPTKLSELNLVIQPGVRSEYVTTEVMDLPKEFISLSDISTLNRLTQIQARHAIAFLHKRNIINEDIIKYNIGFCNKGKYEGRVIIPSYDDNGKINYLTEAGILSMNIDPDDFKISWHVMVEPRN
jgi:hypothetical protein